MFTGLVRDLGTVVSVHENGPGRRVVIETNIDVRNISHGASVCCSGICLTVVDKTSNTLAFDVSAETLAVSNAVDWAAGARVNLEPSLHLGDEIGGHFVFGHVDGVARIESITEVGESRALRISAPRSLMPMIAPKGSVTLDGVSLTVNAVEETEFEVMIIPHTWAVTSLGQGKAGTRVNIEIDMLARYVARLIHREAA